MARDQFLPAWLSKQYSILRQRGAVTCSWVWGAAAPAGRQGLQTIKESSRKTFARLRAMPWQAIASRHWKLLLVIVAVIAVGMIWKVPQWQAAGWQGQMEPKDLAKLQNDARTTLVQALGGAVLLIGLYFTLKNLRLTQDRQITEQYTRAVEQLGSDQLAVRLGAIYALERIAKDSERDHWPIMEILTAYIREHAPYPEKESPLLGSLPAIDIEAILTVLERRNWTCEQRNQRLDLRRTDLYSIGLSGAHLEGAILAGTRLEWAFLHGIHVEKAMLPGAYLKQADSFCSTLGGSRAHNRRPGKSKARRSPFRKGPFCWSSPRGGRPPRSLPGRSCRLNG